MSTGHYHRWGIFNERRRYVSALAQKSEPGHPKRLVDTDFTDWARIVDAQHQRFAQLFVSSVARGWRLENYADDETNNFIIRGGDNTAEGASAALVGGRRAILYRDADYKCQMNTGVDDAVRMDEIHHRWTSVALNKLIDSHARYTVNALVGLSLWIGGVGAFEVTGNTATEITLAGFDPAEHTFEHQFYYVQLLTPVEDVNQPVYLDVHLEDWGMTEDSGLNHNPGGTPIEGMRRQKIIQWVWVDQSQVAGSTMCPTAATYLDGSGTRHYVMRIGVLPREVGVDAVDPVNDRVEGGPLSGDVLEAWTIGLAACLGISEATEPNRQPQSLADRLDRTDSFVTVGDGVEGGSTGMYIGAAGLQMALNCATKTTVFVQPGTYDFSTSQLRIPAGKRLVGGGPDVIINTLITGDEPAVYMEADSSIEGVDIRRLSSAEVLGPLVYMSSYGCIVRRCKITDNDGSGPAVMVGSAYTWGCRVDECVIKAKGQGVWVGAGDDTDAPGASSYTSLQDIIEDGSHLAPAISRCVIASLVETGEQDSDKPLIDLHAGVGVMVDHCAVQGRTTLLQVHGSSASPKAPTSYSARDEFLITNNVFLGIADSGFIGMEIVRIGSGRTIFERNFVDVVGVTGIGAPTPSFGVLVQSDSGWQICSAVIRNNCVRGAGSVGIRATNSQYDHAEIDIEHNWVLPYNASYPEAIGVYVDADGLRHGHITVRGNYVIGGETTAAAVYALGGATVENNDLDGYETAEVEEDADAEPASAASIGIDYFAGGASGTLAAVIRGNRIHGFGGVGVKVQDPSGGRVACCIEKNNIDLGARGLIGVYVTDDVAGVVDIRGNDISNTKGRGIAIISIGNNAEDKQVHGNTLRAIGSAQVVGTFAGAAVHGGAVITDNHVDGANGIAFVLDDYSGIVPAVIRGNYAKTTGGGVAVAGKTKVSVKSNVLEEQTGAAIWVSGCNSVEVGQNIVRGSVAGAEAMVLSASNNVVVQDNELAPMMSAEAAVLSISACSNVRAVNNNIAPPVASKNTYLVILSTCAGRVELTGNTCRSTAKGVYVNVAADAVLEIINNSIQAGMLAGLDSFNVANRSLVVSLDVEPDGVEISNNRLSHGLVVQASYTTASSNPQAVVRGNKCKHLGIMIDAPRPHIIDNILEHTAGASAHVLNGSGIWVGSAGQTPADAVADRAKILGAVICGNIIPECANIGSALSVDAEDGRAAAIVARVGAGFDIKSNIINAAGGIGVLIGYLNYIAPSGVSNSRVGAQGGTIRDNDITEPARAIVLVTGGVDSCFEVKGNVIRSMIGDVETVWVFSQNPAADAPWVLFRGNEANNLSYADLGTLRRSAGVALEVGKTPTEAAAGLTDLEALRRSNMMVLGDDIVDP